jgi:hypothetical protein
LVVLAHGLYGAATDMDQIGDCLHEKFKDGVILLKANSYEGIDLEKVQQRAQTFSSFPLSSSSSYSSQGEQQKGSMFVGSFS